MTSADAVTQAMQTLKTQIAQFRTDLKTVLSAGDGSETALKAAVDNAVQADQTTIGNLDTAYWTARETSRLDEFAYNDARRTGIIANLTAKGIDDTQAQAQPSRPRSREREPASNPVSMHGTRPRSRMQTTSPSRSPSSSRRRSRALPGRPGRQPGSRGSIIRRPGCRTRWQTSRQGVRTSPVRRASSPRSTALRSQLQTAMENQDKATLSRINSQLVSLDQQYIQSVRGILAGSRQQRAQDRAMNRTGFNSTNTGAARFSYGRHLTAINGSAPQ